MGRPVTKPDQQRDTRNDIVDIQDSILNTLSQECSKGNYILVVGSEAILTKEDIDNKTDQLVLDVNGDSTKLFFELTKERLRKEGIQDTISQNFNQLLRHHNNLYQTVREVIRNDWNFKDCWNTEFEPSLLKLLKTKCFRIVLTTAVDPYLEWAMENVWGKNGYRVCNIYGDEKDIPKNEIFNDEFNDVKPTLYYVFGKADVENRESEFVLSENDAMKVIKTWFSSNRPEELLRYICGSGKKVLAVGCNFDDWLFRFFWFVLRGDVDNLRNGHVCMEFPDERLIQYLSAQNIGLLQNSQGSSIFKDARDFMDKAAKRIEDAMEDLPKMLGGIFISYAHEDKEIVFPLAKRLASANFNVWMDEKLNPTDNYDDRIKDAIGECKIFMPILSSQVKNDLLNGKTGRYYIATEWELANTNYTIQRNVDPKSKNNMKVLPVVIGDYNVRESYHQLTTSCIKKVTCCDLTSRTYCDLTTNTFDSLKAEIIKILTYSHTDI